MLFCVFYGIFQHFGWFIMVSLFSLCIQHAHAYRYLRINSAGFALLHHLDCETKRVQRDSRHRFSLDFSAHFISLANGSIGGNERIKRRSSTDSCQIYFISPKCVYPYSVYLGFGIKIGFIGVFPSSLTSKQFCEYIENINFNFQELLFRQIWSIL